MNFKPFQPLSLRLFLSLFLSAFLGASFLLSSAHGAVSAQSQYIKLISTGDQSINTLNSLRANKMKFMATQKTVDKAEATSNSTPSITNADLIISIYDRLIFALASRYKRGDVHEFLSEYCISLAEAEQRNKRPLVEFYAHLSDVIKNSREERENLSLVIENYIHAAPVEKPLSAARYILNNSYSNGNTSARALGIGVDDLGPKEEPLTVEKISNDKVSDFEFSGEIEDWFSRNVPAEEAASDEAVTSPTTEPENKDSQTNESSSLQTQPSESATPQLDNPAPSDKPVSNSEKQQPPVEYSQTTTASASEPKLEKAETK